MVGQPNVAEVLVEGVSTYALIDTGSQVTTIALSLVEKFDCELKALDSLTVLTAGGNTLPYLGYVEVTLEIAPKLGVPIDVLALVIHDSNCDPNIPVLIGTNVLEVAYDSLISVKDTLDKPLRNVIKYMPKGDLDGIVGQAKSTRVEVLPPKSKIIVSGLTRAAAHCSPINVVTKESSQFQLPGGVLVSQCLIQAGGIGSTSKVHVELVNTSDRQRQIPAGVVLCNLQKVTVVNYAASSVAAENVDWLDEFAWPDDPDHANAVRELVLKWKDVFSVHDLDYGRTNLVEHKINMVDETPINIRHRRIPPGMYDEVRAYLDELLAAGQIRPSHSPWSFPLVLVRKKQGGLRLCIDYRKLNERCIRDVFPLPRLDETMDALIGARYFSRLDLRSGYYQIPMYEPHKQRTAFSAGVLGFF